jgi:hypothetical protein
VNSLALIAVLLLASAAHAESFGIGPNGVWLNPYPPPYTYPYTEPYVYPYHPPEWWRWHQRRHEYERHEEHR